MGRTPGQWHIRHVDHRQCTANGHNCLRARRAASTVWFTRFARNQRDSMSDDLSTPEKQAAAFERQKIVERIRRDAVEAVKGEPRKPTKIPKLQALSFQELLTYPFPERRTLL